MGIWFEPKYISESRHFQGKENKFKKKLALEFEIEYVGLIRLISILMRKHSWLKCFEQFHLWMNFIMVYTYLFKYALGYIYARNEMVILFLSFESQSSQWGFSPGLCMFTCLCFCYQHLFMTHNINLSRSVPFSSIYYILPASSFQGPEGHLCPAVTLQGVGYTLDR